MSQDQKIGIGVVVAILLLARLTQPMPVVYGLIGGLMIFQTLFNDNSEIWRTYAGIIGTFIVGAVMLSRGFLW